MKSLRTITAVAASVAVAAGAATPAFAQTAGGYPSDASSSSQADKPGKRGKHRKPRRLTDARLTTVATALGTTRDTLKAAQAKVKAAVDATDARETRAERDALLATELDVTVEQLRTAFASVRGTTGGMCKNKPRPNSGSGSGSYPTDAPAA